MKHYVRYVSWFACLIIIMCITSYGNSANNNDFAIKITGLDRTYYKGQTVKFKVHNNTANLLYFYCSVEKYLDGTWQEFLSSVEKTRMSKSVKLSKISPKQTVSLSWNPMRLKALQDITRNGFFRLKVIASKNPGEAPLYEIYSQKFELQ